MKIPGKSFWLRLLGVVGIGAAVTAGYVTRGCVDKATTPPAPTRPDGVDKRVPDMEEGGKVKLPATTPAPTTKPAVPPPVPTMEDGGKVPLPGKKAGPVPGGDDGAFLFFDSSKTYKT